MKMYYHTHYSDKTYLQRGIVGNGEDMFAVGQARRQHGLYAIGECWVPNDGIRLMWEGPSLDQDVLDLLCVQMSTPEIVSTLNKV